VAHTDIIVLGAGIVGTSIATHLAKRGLAVALVDRAGPGEGTSYGNTGIIEGNTIFPAAFPSNWVELARIALNRAPQANYHLSFLPRVAPWLAAFRAASRPARLVETAHVMRPLFAQAVNEHQALVADADAGRYLRRLGWLKLYRSERAFASLAPELELAAQLGIANVPLDRDAALALEPSLAPVFRHAVHWAGAVSVTNPLALTRAYAARFAALGGLALTGDARSLHRANSNWRVDTAAGPLDAGDVVIALGPWTPDVLKPLGINLPLAVKRGYHRHYRPQGNATLSRPVLDAENGYCLAPMEQGTRVTTGAEFAARDAAPTPVQFDRLLPAARELFPLGEPVETQPWMGARPCFADSRPVISRAPRQPGLWLAYGHGHWGLTLGPATGRLIAEMMTGATPFCDPKPYSADRFPQ
jgi:D-amino-acid dehydrogenase